MGSYPVFPSWKNTITCFLKTVVMTTVALLLQSDHLIKSNEMVISMLYVIDSISRKLVCLFVVGFKSFYIRWLVFVVVDGVSTCRCVLGLGQGGWFHTQGIIQNYVSCHVQFRCVQTQCDHSIVELVIRCMCVGQLQSKQLEYHSNYQSIIQIISVRLGQLGCLHSHFMLDFRVG